MLADLKMDDEYLPLVRGIVKRVSKHKLREFYVY
jgi:hypothetical protein